MVPLWLQMSDQEAGHIAPVVFYPHSAHTKKLTRDPGLVGDLGKKKWAHPPIFGVEEVTSYTPCTNLTSLLPKWG